MATFSYRREGLGLTRRTFNPEREELINKGFDVKYDTIQNIITDFEQKQFRATGDISQDDDPRQSVILSAIFLIIDDLGTLN